MTANRRELKGETKIVYSINHNSDFRVLFFAITVY
jgi:hypothetical protein